MVVALAAWAATGGNETINEVVEEQSETSEPARADIEPMPPEGFNSREDAALQDAGDEAVVS